MKNLTLVELQEAIAKLGRRAGMQNSVARRVSVAVGELQIAERYLTGEERGVIVQPTDPREILTSLNYKW